MVQRRLLLASAAFAAAVPAAPAAAQSRVHFAFSGSVTLSWHGDPARGCAAAGLCDYAGSVTMGPPASSDVQFSDGVVAGFGSGGLSDTALAVRVVREAPGGAGGSCVDALPGEPVEFVPDRVASTRYALRLAADLSAGRCAGPLPGELITAVGAPEFDLAKLGASGVTVRWPSRSLAAGPFSGDVTSSLAARVTRARPVRRRPPPAAQPSLAQRLRTHRVWTTTGSWAYRVRSVSGTAGARVEGAGDCVLLDSCGVAGTLDYRLAATTGQLVISANRLAATPPRRTRTGAVDLGALSLYGFGELGTTTGTLTASLTRPGETPCADADPLPVPDLSARRVDARRLAITFGDDSGTDLLRSRCPGPSQADVFGAGSIARATIPLRDLGRPRLRVTLTRGGAFSAPGYAGTRHAALTLDLRLKAVHRLRTVHRRLP
jgi:hypothetical protein